MPRFVSALYLGRTCAYTYATGDKSLGATLYASTLYQYTQSNQNL
jgi:hypothetical protein